MGSAIVGSRKIVWLNGLLTERVNNFISLQRNDEKNP